MPTPTSIPTHIPTQLLLLFPLYAYFCYIDIVLNTCNILHSYSPTVISVASFILQNRVDKNVQTKKQSMSCTVPSLILTGHTRDPEEVSVHKLVASAMLTLRSRYFRSRI